MQEGNRPTMLFESNPSGNKSWKNDKYQNEIVYHKTSHTFQSIAIGINT
jgi:hypothetical protein